MPDSATMADLRRKPHAAASHRQSLGSSLKGGTGQGGVVVVVTVSGRFRRVLGMRHPQPGSRRSARNAARTNGLEAGEDDAILIQPGAGGAVCGVQLSGSVFMVAEDQLRRGRGVWLPVIPSPLVAA